MRAHFASSLLLMEEGGKTTLRLKPKVKYKLPDENKEPFFARWMHRKVKQAAMTEFRRENADVIHFI